MNVEEFTVVTGAGRSAESASADLFPPGSSIVLVDTELCGPTVVYHFLVERPT